MTFRCVATVRDGRKSVLGAKGKFWSVRERERERERRWMATNNKRADRGGRHWGSQAGDGERQLWWFWQRPRRRRSQHSTTTAEEEESGVSIWMASLNTSITVFQGWLLHDCSLQAEFACSLSIARVYSGSHLRRISLTSHLLLWIPSLQAACAASPRLQQNFYTHA